MSKTIKIHSKVCCAKGLFVRREDLSIGLLDGGGSYVCTFEFLRSTWVPSFTREASFPPAIAVACCFVIDCHSTVIVYATILNG